MVPALLLAQDVATSVVPASPAAAPTAPEAPAEKSFPIPIGTKVLLSMVNSVSTKHTQTGDRVYLETTYPVAVNGRIVIPAGSYVMGTITSTKRPGKVKGKGEFFLRFDSLMLPNGVNRDFRATVSNLDGRAAEDLDKDEGVIRSEGNKSGDARAIGETAAWGASIGGLAGIGRAPAWASGLVRPRERRRACWGVLLTRGPDAVLAKGTTIEMVLDRPVTYVESELDFTKAPPQFRGADGGGPMPSVKAQQGRRF
ncbi:MAG: hypothetical protein WDO18_11770 [Acidobacteriota bacterium]